MQWASPLPPEWKCSCTSAWILYSSPDPGDALVDVDWNVVKSAGKPTDVIVVFTNPAKIDKLSITAKGAVATGAPIGTIVTK